MRQRERGSVLIFSYLIVAALVAWGSATVARTLNEQGTSQRYTRLASAFHAAEAGLDQALVNLEADPAWSGTTAATEVSGAGYYEVAVEDDASGYKTLTITGHYPTNDPTAFGYQRRQIEAVVNLKTPSVFQFGLFGDENVKIEDSALIDSYDSTQGQYFEQAPGEHGDIGTNSIQAESVVLEAEEGGQLTVKGQVLVGPDLSNPPDAVKIEGNVTISGNPDVASQSNTMDLPAITEPATCEGDTVIGDGQSLALDETTQAIYCYTSLKVEGTGAITVAGDVTVFTRKLQVENNAEVNGDGKPTQLVFKITTSQDVKLENNGKFRGAIYAPDSEVKLENNVIFYGSVAGKEVKVENATAVHYDEALRYVGPSTDEKDALLLSWREL